MPIKHVNWIETPAIYVYSANKTIKATERTQVFWSVWEAIEGTYPDPLRTYKPGTEKAPGPLVGP